MKRIWQFIRDDEAGRSALWVRIGNVGQGLAVAVAVVLFLTPTQQGVWYALASLMSVASMAELGFAQLVVQVVAHDVAARPEAAGLRSAYFWITLRFALIAATAYAALFAIASLAIGLNRPELGGAAVFAAAATGALVMGLAPLNGFFEGLLQIAAANRRRVAQIAAYVLGCIGGLTLGWGLWSVPAGLAASFLVGLGLLVRDQRHELAAIRATLSAPVSWARVFWPLQSRYAMSWLSGVLFHGALAPLLLARSGAIEAGRFGLTWALFQACVAVSVVWVAGRSAQFAMQISSGAGSAFHADFWRRFRWAISIYGVTSLLGVAGLLLLATLLPEWAARLVSPQTGALVALAGGFTLLLQLLYIYGRSFREEPFVGASWIANILVLALAYALAPGWGGAGVSLAVIAGQGVVVPSVLMKLRNYARRLNLPRVVPLAS